MKILKSVEASILEKRALTDQNEFLNHLFDKYEHVLDR